MCASECCGRSRGNQQTTSDQHGRDVSKGHKSSDKGGREGGQEERPGADRRMGKGATIVADWHIFKPVFNLCSRRFQEDKGGYSDT